MKERAMNASMTPEQFRAWRNTQGFTLETAAEALGLGRATLQLYERGRRFETDEQGDAAEVEIPRHVALACAAIAAGLKPAGS